MARTDRLEILGRERVGALGQTGSGKTHLMLQFVNGLEDRHVVIIDTKRSIQLTGYTRTSDWRKAAKPKIMGGKVIYRPEASKPPDDFYRLLWARYSKPRRSANLTLYIDEAAHITGPGSIPDSLELILQAGREVGFGVWWAGQQSVTVNNTLLSQSEKLAVFRLPVESDRKKVANIVGKSAMLVNRLPQYHFFAYGFGYDPVWAEGTTVGHAYTLREREVA